MHGGVSVQKVNKVINPLHKQWNERKLQSLVSGADCDAILSIPISVADKDDTLIWHHDSKGCYKVKSRYHEAVNQAHLGSNLSSSSMCWSEKEWRFVWNLNLPPKLKHFVWRIYHNALATCQNLFSKRCANTACCPLCLTAPESIEHLLFDCDWSKRVWFGCNLGLRCDDLGSLSVRDWFGNCFTSLGTSSWGKSVICSMIWVAWTIWKGRNDHLFNRCLVDPAGVIRKAKHNEAEFLATCTVTTTPVLAVTGVNNTGSAWVPPPRGKWKFNCDAAFDLRQGTGAVAVLLRDHLGILVDGMVCKVRVRSVAQGELLAVRHACLMAGALNLAAVDIESDCKSVIHLCVSEGVPPWELLALLNDVRSMATSRQLNFLWCPRMGNRAAHWVASAYLHNSLPTDWVAQPPMGLVRCLSSNSM